MKFPLWLRIIAWGVVLGVVLMDVVILSRW